MLKHILIVEDDKQLAEAVTDVLQKAGYETTVCTAYNNVVSCMQSNNIDLVILDGYLHEYDGRTLLQQIKNNPQYKHVPVVFASVMTSKDLKGYNPDAILPKAYGMHELLEVVRKLLNNR